MNKNDVVGAWVACAVIFAAAFGGMALVSGDSAPHRPPVQAAERPAAMIPAAMIPAAVIPTPAMIPVHAVTAAPASTREARRG